MTEAQQQVFQEPLLTEDERIDAVRAAWFERQSLKGKKRSGRLHPIRARTVSISRMPKRELAIGADLYPPEDVDVRRPSTRADCANVPRPCPFVSCRYNAFLDVSACTGAIKMNFPDREPHELPPHSSCSLDIAERDGTTLEAIGAVMNLTRERVRQIELNALRKCLDSRHGGTLKELHGGGHVVRRRLLVLHDFDPED